MPTFLPGRDPDERPPRRPTTTTGNRADPPARTTDPRAARPARGEGGGQGRHLTLKQKAALGILSRHAFAHQDSMGLVDDRADGQTQSAHFLAWKHAQQMEAVGVASTSAMRQSHYRPLRAHYLTMLGRDVDAFDDMVTTGPAPRGEGGADTYETREQTCHLIEEARRTHNIAAREHDYQTMHANYIMAIARRKFRMPRLSHLMDLTTRQLTQLLYTVRNRATAMRGGGDTHNRNRSQRRR